MTAALTLMAKDRSGPKIVYYEGNGIKNVIRLAPSLMLIFRKVP